MSDSNNQPAGGGYTAEYVRDLRDEAKAHRLRAEDLAKQIEDLKKANETTVAQAVEKAVKDAQKEAKAALDAALADSTKAADQRVLMAELKAIATKSGMVDLDGLKLADLSSVGFDDKGAVKGADTLMESLKKDKPWLFAAQNTSTTSTPPAGQSGQKHARDMTPQEYAAAEAAFLASAK